MSPRMRHPGRSGLMLADARPWLYGIATNLVSQHRRAEIRQYRIRQAALPELDMPGHAEQVAADETARALDIPVGTVRSRLNQARTKLRDVIADVSPAETVREILRNE